METLLVLLLLLSLLWALYDVLRVFFGVLTFALIFSVSFSGLFEWLSRRLNGRRKLAAVIYAFLLLAITSLPFIYVLSTVRSHVKVAIEWLDLVRANGLPPLPRWIANMPWLGDEITAFWQQLQSSPRETIAVHGAQLRTALGHVLSSGAGVIGATVQFMIGIIISAFFLATGPRMLDPVKSTLQHLLGKRDGLSLLRATIQAIRSVSIGVMGTALVAAILSWTGLTIAGIHFALFLSAVVFFLVLIQLGPLFVWIPVVIWSASQGHPGMTVFLAIYGLTITILDGLLKPVLLAKSGGKVPFLVLFLGVIGGLSAWGFTGMFKGAIILSVCYTLFNSWLEGKEPPTSARGGKGRLKAPPPPGEA
jgi:predicted PurR-regulated permease PerM